MAAQNKGSDMPGQLEMRTRDLKSALLDFEKTLDSECDRAGQDKCFAHSGIKTCLKFIMRENLAQWEFMKTVDKRLWAILIMAGGTGLIIIVETIWKHVISGPGLVQ